MSNSINLSSTVTLYQAKNGFWHLLLEDENTLIELGVFNTKIEAILAYVKSTRKAA